MAYSNRQHSKYLLKCSKYYFKRLLGTKIIETRNNATATHCLLLQ